MNTDLTRQYDLPTPVSDSTHYILEQYKADNNNTSNGTLHIPTLQDLLTMKEDLESLLPLTELRVKDLKEDLTKLDRNTKIRDNGEATTSGKNMNAIMKIKQEADAFDDLDSSSNIPKNEHQSRQAALEAIRRRRRREETESSDEVSRRSESPHHIVKLKKMDNSSPHTTGTDLKKRKSNNNNNNNARAQHPLSESSGNGSGKHSKGGGGSSGTVNNRATPKEELDFVRVKPKDQVPIATFWTAMEPYFRNLTDEDRAFLLEKNDNAKMYLIPPLGQYYMDVWAEEDQSLGFGSHSRSSSKSSSTTDKLKYLQNNELTDENLLQNDIGCGTLTERLLSSLVTEELLDPSELQLEEDEEMDDVANSEDTHSNTNKHHGRTIMELSSEPTDEIVGFEERLRRELRYAGLFGDDDIDWNAKEDDEICAELRNLGRELKEQVDTNEYRKKKLLEVVDSQLQFEQYRQVLDTLDSHVEQGYLKRFRPQKSKKRKSNGPKTVLSENAVFAMDKRRTWIQALGAIFKDKNLIMPTSSIYEQKESEETTTS